MKMIFFNKYIFLCFILFVLGSSSPVQAQFITTLTNLSLKQGYSGDGGPAVQAEFNGPRGVAIDPQGNIFIADAFNNRIRKVDLFGDVTTIAGTGKAGYSGDGGRAIDAELNYPTYIVLDDIGNLYFTDTYNYRVRKIDTGGKITTIAGNGKHIFAGDTSLATAASFDQPPYGLNFDRFGNLYIATKVRVRKVDGNGIIHTVVGHGGSGYGGDGGLATNATSTYFTSIAFDAEDNMYVTEEYYHCIRKIDAAGIITRFAGTVSIDAQSKVTGDGGPAIDARMVSPTDMKFDKAGNLYVTDQGDGRIRKIDKSGIITTFAGNGTNVHSGDGSNAPNAGLFEPYGLAIDNDGNFFFTETSSNNSQKSNDVRFIFGGDVSAASLPIKIYPNPTFNGVFRALFESKYEDDVDIEIVNQAGQVVYRQTGQTNRYIAFRMEPTGVFFIHAKSIHGHWQSKISVVH